MPAAKSAFFSIASAILQRSFGTRKLGGGKTKLAPAKRALRADRRSALFATGENIMRVIYGRIAAALAGCAEIVAVILVGSAALAEPQLPLRIGPPRQYDTIGP